MSKLTFTSRFEKSFKALHPKVQVSASNALQILIDNPDHPGLHMHRFACVPEGWTIRVGRKDRIVFQRTNDDEFLILDIGPHDAVYRRMNRK